MSTPAFQIIVLGSGTSSGVPTIGCKCEVCRSTDPRDKRTRPSILIRYSGRNVIVDTTPDFRTQVLRAGIDRLDAILYTHAHADHILGLDDVRPFNYFQKQTIPVYASEETLAVLRRVFCYAFDDAPQSSVPRLDLRTMTDDPLDLFDVRFEPVRLLHGNGLVYGFKFGPVGYLTDHSAVPEESMAKLHGLDVLFLDALRHRPHPTHTTVEQALRIVDELQPKRVFFTHMCHDLGHERTEALLPPHVRLAYDGLEIETEALP
jgi:phosphoribosyl 1,2-cyclic phosphate phosphodiesterase